MIDANLEWWGRGTDVSYIMYICVYMYIIHVSCTLHIRIGADACG